MQLLPTAPWRPNVTTAVLLATVALAGAGCGGRQPNAPVPPEVAVRADHWADGRPKLEYQFYRTAAGDTVRHGYYREYSQFVDSLVMVAGSYRDGAQEGDWYSRCATNQPLPLATNGDFEAGSFLGWKLEGAQPNSIELVPAQAPNGGRYMARLTLRPGDLFRGGNRTELVLLDPNNYGRERIYSWRFMLDPAYQEEPYWQAFCQFHSQPDFTSGEDWDTYPKYKPALSILYSQGIGRLQHVAADKTSRALGAFPVVRGQWFEVFFQVKWSLHDDGYVEMYVDDRPVTPFNGTDYRVYCANVFNEVNNYVKIGLYRDKRAEQVATAYVDDAFVGACW